MNVVGHAEVFQLAEVHVLLVMRHESTGNISHGRVLEVNTEDAAHRATQAERLASLGHVEDLLAVDRQGTDTSIARTDESRIRELDDVVLGETVHGRGDRWRGGDQRRSNRCSDADRSVDSHANLPRGPHEQTSPARAPAVHDATWQPCPGQERPRRSARQGSESRPARNDRRPPTCDVQCHGLASRQMPIGRAETPVHNTSRLNVPRPTKRVRYAPQQRRQTRYVSAARAQRTAASALQFGAHVRRCRPGFIHANTRYPNDRAVSHIEQESSGRRRPRLELGSRENRLGHESRLSALT